MTWRHFCVLHIVKGWKSPLRLRKDNEQHGILQPHGKFYSNLLKDKTSLDVSYVRTRVNEDAGMNRLHVDDDVADLKGR